MKKRHFIHSFYSSSCKALVPRKLDFPDASDGKESACKARDPGLIPRSGRSSGKGMATHSSIIGQHLPWSWASLVAQRLKCLPAMWETWVRSLGREAPLEKEMATHSSILAWRSLVGSSLWGRIESDMTESIRLHTLDNRRGKSVITLLLSHFS